MKRTNRSPVTAVPVLATLVLSSASLVACQTQPDRNLGDSVDDRSLDLNPPPAPTEPFGESLLEFAGRWVGVAEEPLAFGGVRETYTFPSGSTRFSLEIIPPDELAAPEVGTLAFGSGSTPPSPIDPDVGYPIDVDYSDLDYFQRNPEAALTYGGALPPYEGFAYSLLSSYAFAGPGGDRLLADGVLPLEFDTGEHLTPWCELQTPQPTPIPFSTCVKGNAYSADDEGRCFVGFADLTPEEEARVVAQGGNLEREQVDCNKLFLCVAAQCDCTESECSNYPFADPRSVGRLLLRRDGDTLTGVLSNTVFMNERKLPVPLGTVRFTRVVEE
jgi:hypothetical protein